MYKDCLKERYGKASLVTQHGLECSRLQLLKDCLSLKRPVISLRVSGLRGLPVDQAYSLIQELETKATQKAIENKQREINTITKQIDHLKRIDPGSLQLVKDHRLLQIQKKKLNKKIIFLRECEDTKFSDWKRKKQVTVLAAKHSSKISEKKLKKKMKNKARKDRRKERLIRGKANTALEKNLVINLSDVDSI